MRELIVFVGEILFIVLFQTVIELFFDKDKHKSQMQILNVACILGSLYLLLNFVYDNILSEISTFVKFPF
jgi:hypothetical protein